MGNCGVGFAPVRPGLVIAEGWVERNGRKTAFYEGHLKDAEGRVLAKASTTMMLADRARVDEYFTSLRQVEQPQPGPNSTATMLYNSQNLSGHRQL